MKQDRNTFKYSNKNYTVNVVLYTSTGNESTDLRVSFDANDIEVVEYSTKLNDLLVTGHVVYTDQYAMVDKFLSQHICYCYIYFAEHKPAKNADNSIGDPDPKKTFSHTFIVTNIKPLDRQQHKVKYEIDLVSELWFKCIANVQYTNYDRTEEPVFEIFKNCMVTNDLQVDQESFGRTKADVQIPYMTKLNDNMFTVSQYLMKRLYFMPKRDVSVKFFFYDIFDEKYKLLDLKDKDTFLGTYSTILSMFKTNTEALIQQEPTNLGTFANPLGKTYVYKTVFDKTVYGYSYTNNTFTSTMMRTAENQNYLNNKLDNSNYQLRYNNIPDFPRLHFFQTGSYWNSKTDFYDDSIAMLEQNGALVLNITGDVKRQPGTFTLICLDRSIGNLQNDSKQELEKEKLKYKNYEGVWYNAKVQNIIHPSKPQYRQKVVLFRNFVAKLAATT